MMHYAKGENVEHEIKKEELPFDDCLPNGQKNFLWMRVKGGTKVNNVVTFAKNAIEKGEHRTIVWTGVGGGLVKTVSCAEILKRSHPLYQVTRMCYTNIEEHWLPQMDGLDELIVNRKIPCIHILMSLDEIDESVSGLQKPNTQTKFFGDPKLFNAPNRYGKRQHTRNNDAQKFNQNRNQNADKSDQSSSKYHRHQKEKPTKSDQEGQRKKFTQKNAKKNQAAKLDNKAEVAKPLMDATDNKNP